MIDTGDTAWLLLATALVMFMTPGLALFYGGLVRPKNVLGTIMHSFVALGVVTITWITVGYTLGFGKDAGLFIGGLEFAGLAGVGQEPSAYAPTVPHLAWMAFQMMFAIITPALIAGAFAERIRFGGYVAFIAAWSVLVYAPVAHWVWGGGWLGPAGVGALDFAGGTVVHINAGVAALVAAIYLGKRRGFGERAFVPHNVPMVVTGAAILWFGWFGFNAGSALAANGAAAQAFVTTHVATAAAILGWLLLERLKHGKPTTVGAATGAVAGLVAITPAAGFVAPWAAIAIGFAAGAVCEWAVGLKFRLGYDDSLDVVGVHLVGGLIGALLVGVFAQAAIGGTDGALFGNPGQLGRQALAIVATMAWSAILTLGILKAVDATLGLRVTEEEEAEGLDLSQHAESGYTLAERPGTRTEASDRIVTIPDTPPVVRPPAPTT